MSGGVNSRVAGAAVVCALLAFGWLAWTYVFAPPRATMRPLSAQEMGKLQYQHRVGALEIREQQMRRAAAVGAGAQ